MCVLFSFGGADVLPHQLRCILALPGWSSISAGFGFVFGGENEMKTTLNRKTATHRKLETVAMILARESIHPSTTSRIPSVCSLNPISPHLTESRDGKCPVPEDLGGCGHSRTSSYASQQSKLSGWELFLTAIYNHLLLNLLNSAIVFKAYWAFFF